MRLLVFFTIGCLIVSCAPNQAQEPSLIGANNKNYKYYGRVDFTDPSAPSFSFPGSAIRARFEGTSVTAVLGNRVEKPGTEPINYYKVFIDDSLYSEIRSTRPKEEFLISDQLTDENHTIEIYKRTESYQGIGTFYGLKLAPNKSLLETPEVSDKTIEFIGNSITCGYGVLGTTAKCGFSPETEDAYLSYAPVAARQLKANSRLIAYSGKGVQRNYNLDTYRPMPEYYDCYFPDEQTLRKADLSQYRKADLYVINLGTNDFSHQVPDSAEWIGIYSEFLSRLRDENKAPIICCISTMISDSYPAGNYSRTHISNYLKVILEMFKSQHDENIYLFEFSSQGALGFGCHYHPNIAQQAKGAKELVDFIKANLKGW